MHMDEKELKSLWKNILGHLTKKIPKSQFLTWFRNTEVAEINDNTLVVAVPTEMAFNNIAEKFLSALKESVQEELPLVEHVRLVVDGSLYLQKKRSVDIVGISQMHTEEIAEGVAKDNNTHNAQHEEVVMPTEVLLIDGITSKVLNPKYRLDNFVVGPETQLAYAACSAVARAPGEAYNPLFIYGGVGLGKTHLLQGTGNEILKRYPKKRIVYVTSEKFMNELIEAIGNHKTDQLRRKYRNIDVLIVDDVQFLAQKQQTQIEFFHTFNELYQAKKQIILSSDRPPKELSQLEARLQSRFEWGMIVDVSMPDFETRCAILHSKCQDRGIILSNEVIEFIAHNVQSSIRELEGVLQQAVAQYELTHVTPTIKTIGPTLMKLNKNQRIIGYNSFQGPRTKATTVEDVMNVVGPFYHVTGEDILGETRKKEIVTARSVVMYIAKQDLGMTFERIGELLGGRLHSTVMHACNKVEKAMKKDENMKRDINGLRLELGLLS
ncbi:MAG: chromosomal replication initiator protein DnaA [Candidatus Gracilibacteria bacterium]